MANVFTPDNTKPTPPRWAIPARRAVMAVRRSTLQGQCSLNSSCGPNQGSGCTAGGGATGGGARRRGLVGHDRWRRDGGGGGPMTGRWGRGAEWSPGPIFRGGGGPGGGGSLSPPPGGAITWSPLNAPIGPTPMPGPIMQVAPGVAAAELVVGRWRGVAARRRLAGWWRGGGGSGPIWS